MQRNIQKLCTSILDKLYKSSIMNIMTKKYNELCPKQTKSMFKLIEKQDKNQSFNKDHVKIMASDLPFTNGWKKVSVEDFSSVPFQSKIYLLKDNVLKIMTYTTDPYKNNGFDMLGLDLNDHNIENYLKFYFDFFIRGNDILKPVSHADDIEWQNDFSPTIKQSLDKEFVLYPQINHENDDFLVKMPCVFQQSIMVITFFIQSNGKVEIKDRQSLVDDLPIRNFS